MIDKITIDRIKHLHPVVVDEVMDIYTNKIHNALTGTAYCRFAYTLRTFEEQNELYSRGRTKLFDAKGNRLGIVTNAMGGQSYHNYGIALDIVLIDGNKASWDNVKDYDGDGIADWMEVVNIFKSYGWEWGGDWKKKDSPHFQKTFGYHWKTLLTKYQNKEFLPNSKYLKL
jgi:peptidoglycan L-alanyl-D-glutamate endopeptidase CwlK